MPRVPVSEGAAVQQDGARPAYQNLDFNDGTRALQQGIGELSQAVGNVQQVNEERARKAKERADGIAADSLFTQAQQTVTQKLHGYDAKPAADAGAAGYGSLTEAQISGVGEPGDHVPGYLDTRGTDAHAQSADTLEAIQKKFDGLLSAAGNEQQRAIVRQRFGTLYESVRAQVAEHEGAQFRVADQAATAGLLTTTLNSAATLYNRPDDVAKLTDDALASLKRSSLPQEFEAKKQEFQSKVSQTMIDGYLQHGDLVGASAQYGRDEKLLGNDGERVKAKLDEAMKAHVQEGKDIEGATAAKAAFDSATDQKKGAGRADGVGAYAAIDPLKARAEVEKLPEGPVKVAATRFLEHRLEVAKQEKRQAVDDVFASALAAYQKTGTLAAVSAQDKLWLQNPDNKVGEQDGWEKLRSIARADAEHARALPPTPDQQRAMTQFLVDLHDHPEKYATMPEGTYNAEVVPGLAKNDRERAGAAFALAHNQASKPGTLTPDETKMLLQTGRSAGLFPDKVNDVSKWDDGEAELYYQASKDLTDWATSYRQQHGKAPKPDELKKQADELVLKGKVPGTGILGFFQKKQTRLEAEVSGKPYEPIFTEEDKTAAAAALKKAGARADDTAVETYLRRKHKLPAAPQQPAAAAPASAAPAPTLDTPDIPSSQD